MKALLGRPGLLLALAALWLAATTWIRPLALPDEGRYVGVAWEMLRSGDWLMPTLDGLPYFHKPPLFYWITASALAAFGNVEWAARAAPWAGGCLMAGAVLLFGRRHLGAPAAAAWLAVLAGMPLVMVASQYANLDMLVAGCITATVLAFAHSLSLPAGDPSRRRWHLAGCVFAALGVLAKGLIGAVLPGLVLVAWLLAARRPRDILSLFWWPGVLVFLAVAAPWFIAMQQRFPDFLHYFFGVHHFGRFTQASFNNARPAWFYLAVLALTALPWTPWLLRRAAPSADAHERGLRLLMGVWLVAIVGFFSIPNSKLVGYVLPAAPPLAFLLAQRWRAALQGGRWARGLARASAVASVALCVGFVVAASRHEGDPSGRQAAAVVAGAPHPVVFLHEYPFDLAFYARLRAPVWVVEAWDDPKTTQADNWRRELWEASAFASAADRARLLRPFALAAPNCPGAVSWVVGPPDQAERYPLLARARRVDAGDHAVWELRDWSPACPGTPSANSPGT